MELVIDARKIKDFGIGVYIENLIKGLKDRIDFYLLCYKEDLSFENCVYVKSKGYSLYEQWEIWRVLNRLKPELFHSPHYVFPLLYKGKIVITVHDVIHLLFPQFFSKAARTYAKFMLSRGVTKAEIIITVSRKSKEDIIRLFPEAEDRITVIHNGINPVFFIPPNEEEKRWAEKFSPYILAVGNNKPHKRFGLLLREFSRVREKFPELNLVIAGWEGINEDGIYTVGKITKERLAALYHKAELLVHPALYEGFGFPPFEAAACGTPVISSKVGAVEEILGENVLYFEEENLADVILYAFRNRDKINSMAINAQEITKSLTWEKSAEKHFEIYRRLL